MYASTFLGLHADTKGDAHFRTGAMGNAMALDTIELDVEMIQNYRYREMQDEYAVHLYAQNAIATPTLDWSIFHTARGRLVHRIFSTGSALGLKRETCHLACSYMTRVFLSSWLARGQIFAPNFAKTAEHPNILMAATVLVLASKIEEVNPPSVTDILEAVQRESGETVPDHAKAKGKGKRGGRSKKVTAPSIYTTKEDVIAHEEALLKQLKWKLYPATPITWLLLAMDGLGLYKEPSSPPSPAVYNSPCYVGYEYGGSYDYADKLRKDESRLQRAKERMTVFHLACNLLDVATLDSFSINFLPSVLGGAALFLLAPTHNLYALSHLLLVKPENVWECVVWMQHYLPYVTQPVPLSVHAQFQSKLAKVPQEDRYAVQVLSTSTAFGTLVFYPMAHSSPQAMLLKTPPSPQEPVYEPESEWSPSTYFTQHQPSLLSNQQHLNQQHQTSYAYEPEAYTNDQLAMGRDPYYSAYHPQWAATTWVPSPSYN
ncbi:hypothetical protein SDRG_12303 [Saprolegnia diclina VS20]|uniref:Cyclin N-terminal domain-containing protein n=1 Tax=Saprolegnia diclina (strain VS20) TaxID=1156394 RepID=T0RCT7_SAPDV|nr:hypothetical protein SDRG_12303 [Saprolegnia diclina VS20]EQC30023.1 hypothetical protein SDRG_12303 [Saprolegnia diclina VS20]|eukprot:XP_008616590.1 hypothetical protein SDRG_12303 [Saprolegnia diclina VS20]